MGALLESGMVGNIGLKHLKVIKEDTLAQMGQVLDSLMDLKVTLKKTLPNFMKTKLHT